MKRHSFIVPCLLCLTIALHAEQPPDERRTDAQPPANSAPAAKDPSASWPDRRPIGVVFLSEGGRGPSQPGFRTAKNPRGWNPSFHKDRLGKPLDVADPQYAEKFDAAVDAFALQSFDRAERLGCQGVLIWDVEGSEFDHPTT